MAQILALCLGIICHGSLEAGHECPRRQAQNRGPERLHALAQALLVDPAREIDFLMLGDDHPPARPLVALDFRSPHFAQVSAIVPPLRPGVLGVLPGENLRSPVPPERLFDVFGRVNGPGNRSPRRWS